MTPRNWWNRLTTRSPASTRRPPRRPLTLEPLEDRTVPTAGALDPTFGSGGSVVFNLPGSNRSVLNDVALQPDGKILAVGGINAFSNAEDFAVARFNPNGTLDPSFGSGGLVTTDFLNNTRSDEGRSVAVQPDGKIVVGGITSNATFRSQFALARYNPDGSLDTTFGPDGTGKVIPPPMPGDANIWDIALQSDGKVVAVGGNGHFVVARFNTDGSLDTSFGGTGVVTTTTGPLVFQGSEARSVVIQPNGKIVAGGQTANGNHAFARYNTDGSLDTSFGGTGVVSTTFGFNRGEDILGVALQPDGKIVGTGVVNAPNATMDIGVVRLNPDGSLDTTFGGTGLVETDLGGSDDKGLSVAVQPDGHIVIAGYRGIPGGQDSLVIRYNTDGSIDTTFGNSGSVVINYAPGNNDVFSAVQLQPDGNIVAGGSVGSAFDLARLIGVGPVAANAGGPYSVAEGGTVQLDGSRSAGVGLTYQWDLNGNGIFGETGAAATRGDEVGAHPTFSAAGLDGPSTFTVGLRVTDNTGQSASATAIVNIIDVGPTAALSPAPAQSPEGTAINLTASATDPSPADTAAGFTFSWTVTKTRGTVTVTYASGTGTAIAFTPDDDGTYVVSVTAADRDGAVSAPATATIAVTNVAPTATVAGPDLAVPGQPLTFTLTASDPSPVDQAVGFVYAIDWDGDGTVDQTVTGPGSLQVDHTYTQTGSFTVHVTATDKDQGTGAAATQLVTVVAATLEPDPADGSKTTLFVGGTLGDDTIRFKSAGGSVEVVLNGVSLGKFAPTARIIAYGQAGNDDIRVASGVGLPAVLYGGDGNDRLEGGSGADVLLGGAGDDTLIARGSRDLLIGGGGADTLQGGAGEDILIGGTTPFEQNLQALDAIMAEWTSGGDYVTRISHLQGTNPGGLNGSYLLTSATVADDGAADVLTGSGGLDWFFAHVTGSGALDTITDLGKNELVTQL